MALHEIAGKPAPRSLLANIPRLVAAYCPYKPDASDPAQRVAFGTPGQRGSSLLISFNENHILAVSQAICEHRTARRTCTRSTPRASWAASTWRASRRRPSPSSAPH